MAKIMTDSKHYTDIANAIREKTGSTEQMKPSEMSEHIRSIQADGGEDLWQHVTQLRSTFQNATFPEGTELSLNVPLVNAIDMPIYGATGLKKLTLKGNLADNAISGTYAFSGRFEELDLTGFGTFGGIIFDSTAKYAFMDSTRLKYIRGVIDLSNVVSTANTNNMFRYDGMLEEVRFKPLSIKIDLKIPSSVLSADSIQSIADGLADLTGQTAQTLTLHATVGAKLTDAQKATITAKNWTLVY